MIKTIQALTPTSHIHPAVGRLYNVVFTDSSSVFMYEESFFDFLKSEESESEAHRRNWQNLVGRQVDLETAFVVKPETLLKNREV